MYSLDRYQWLAFFGVNIAGASLSRLLGWLFMSVFLNPDRIVKSAEKRLGQPLLVHKSMDHLGTRFQPWVGVLEILLYSSAVVYEHPEFIAVWLGTKYLAAYKTWGEDPIGRTFYNRSLFGSGLNILIGVATGVGSLLAIHRTQELRPILLQMSRIAMKGASMLQLVVGAIIAIIITIVVEILRRPHLELSIETPPHDVTYPNAPANRMRSLRVQLSNKPLRWMVRAPALQCRATIAFQHLDGLNIFSKAMNGRWSNSPEPVSIPIVGADDNVVQFRILDIGRLTTESRIDVYPGESELLDIAVRLDEEQDCYGWNNETYFCITPWRNADWKLPCGRFITRVEIVSSGQKCEGDFFLLNEGARTDFRLEPIAHP
jgi:hypothetical protein